MQKTFDHIATNQMFFNYVFHILRTYFLIKRIVLSNYNNRHDCTWSQTACFHDVQFFIIQPSLD